MKTLSKLNTIAMIFIAMFLFTSMHAQDARFGFRVGALISNQNFKSANLNYRTNSKLGLDLALVTDFPIGEVASISPEFHWLQKGTKFEDLNGTLGEVSSTLNYLELPVLLKIHFGGEDLRFLVFGGPSFGYLLDGSDKDHDGNKTDIDLDFYKRVEIGLHAGAGVQIGPAVIDLRYIYGVSNISDSEIEITNHGLGAGISLMF